MGLKCQISFNKQGKATVMTKDGSPSVLYNDLLEITGNQEEALKYWASAYLDDFSNYTDKTEESASANDVAAYYDAKAVGDKKLSVQDKWSVSSFMKKNGIQSLSELQSKLHKIFKKDGVFFINGDAAVKSGLYSSDEIENINPQQIINLLQQIEGQLLVEDILVVPETQKFSYKNNDYKTIFGTAERISEEKIDEEILAEINSIADVEAVIQNLPYTEFVEDFNNKPAFRAKVLKRFEGLKKINHLSIFEGQLTEENINDEKLIENTILDNIPYTNIEAEAEYLESIDEDIWAIMPNQVTDVLKEIEDELIDQNIDLIGMNKFVGKKQEITDVLRAVVAMAKNPTTATIKTFAAAKRALFEEKPVENKSFIKSTSTLSLFRVDTNLSQSELFDKHSLIKVGENLYHKVKKSENAALYDFLYKRIKDGTFSIPSTYTDVNDKVAVIKDLTTYVFSINENIRPDLAENFVLHKLAFDHKVEDSLAKAMDNFRRATSTRTNVDYLKTEFVSDFYNYILTEKQKDSEVYREVLQHFRISDNDISLTKNIASIANLDVTKELEDYIRIKRDSSMNYLISDESRFNEDLFYLNHPEFVKELSETYRQQGDYLLTDPTNNTWVKVGNDVYKNIYSAQGRDLFRKVNTKPDEVYYNTVDNFAFDLREVKEIIQTMLPAKSVYTKLKEKRDSIKEYFLPKASVQKQVIEQEEPNDLNRAREMELAGKTPLEIKVATGWERGNEPTSLFTDYSDNQVLDMLKNLNIIEETEC
jgi:hypothetical protein